MGADRTFDGDLQRGREWKRGAAAKGNEEAGNDEASSEAAPRTAPPANAPPEHIEPSSFVPLLLLLSLPSSQSPLALLRAGKTLPTPTRQMADGNGVVHRLPGLPNELVLRILTLAAEDFATAHALAYVSRTVCRLTAAQRWDTIVVSSLGQLARLWSVIYCAAGFTGADQSVRERFPEAFVQAGDVGSSAWDEPFSLPSATPGAYVRALFVEGSGDGAGESSAATLQDLVELTPRKRDSRTGTSRLEGCTGDRGGAEAGTYRNFLDWFPHLDVLSLGADEAATLLRGCTRLSPRELTLVYEGDEQGLRDVLTDTSVDLRADGNADPQTGSSSSLRKRLCRLHLVAIDPRSGVAGVDVPFQALEPLRAGSSARASFIGHTQTQMGTEPPSGASSSTNGREWDRTHETGCRGLTHRE